MTRHLIVLPDGREIFSGAEGSAVMECAVTQSVSTGKELTPGAVCSAMAELTLWEDTPLPIGAGDALTLYTVDEAGNRRKTGVFLGETPTRTGKLLKLTAYDRLRLLDRDLTGFLAGLEDWPYSLLQLADTVCAACGLQLQNEDIPNGSFPVEQFTGEGITGRAVMEWIAQAAGCFCVADPSGQPVLRWYEDAPLPLGAQDVFAVQLQWQQGQLTLTAVDAAVTESAGTVTLDSAYIASAGDGTVTVTADTGLLQRYCLSGGISLEESPTAPICKVVLRQKDTDVGTAWPENTDGCALCITGNPLLAAKDAATLLPVAQTLYGRFGGVSYTPGTLKAPQGEWEAGQRLTVTDLTGKTHSFYIMQLQRTAACDTLTCTGSANRESVEAVENRSARSLAGKLLSLQADVEGLHAENADAAGRTARLELDVEGIRGQVSAQSGAVQQLQTRQTTLEQTADGLRLSVEKLQSDGAAKLKTAMGYTFDDSGLQISRSGGQMKNRLDNTGMYVTRSGETILQANDRGVAAADVSVRSYLIVGDHARFENYTAGRTACFWLED